MAAEQKKEIIFTVQGHSLPEADWGGFRDIRLGLQQGDAIIENRDITSDSMTFTFPIVVQIKPATDEIDFSGAFVHGKRGERFLYLCWSGTDPNGERQRFRRIKIPLGRLDRADVLAAVHQGTRLGFAVRLTDDRGAPAAATLPPSATERLL